MTMIRVISGSPCVSTFVSAVGHSQCASWAAEVREPCNSEPEAAPALPPARPRRVFPALQGEIRALCRNLPKSTRRSIPSLRSSRRDRCIRGRPDAPVHHTPPSRVGHFLVGRRHFLLGYPVLVVRSRILTVSPVVGNGSGEYARCVRCESSHRGRGQESARLARCAAECAGTHTRRPAPRRGRC